MKNLLLVPDADMRCRHEGLMAQAIKKGAKRKEMNSKNLLVFLNSKRDRIQILGFRDENDKFGILSSWRSPSGRVPLEAIQYIPEFYGGGAIDMDGATRKALEKMLKKRSPRKKKGTA